MGFFSYVDIGESMETLERVTAHDAVYKSTYNLAKKIQLVITTAIDAGQAAVYVKLPERYDPHMVKNIVRDLKCDGFKVEQKHSSDELYISWITADITDDK